jgi:small-conductance mechanosensitive channel
MDYSALLENEYVQCAVIIVCFAVFARLFHLFLKSVVKKLTELTKNNVDDRLLAVSKTPLYGLIIFGGVYFALRGLSYLNPYQALLGKMFFVLYVVLVTWLLSRVFTVVISAWMKVQKGLEKTPYLVEKIVSILFWICAVIVLLRYFNIAITPIVATLGVGGLAVGLALQNTLTNFFAGIHLVTDKPIKVGDFIELEGGVSGYVMDIGWRSTRIMKTSNNVIIIPNSKIAESVITNDSLPDNRLSVAVECSVSFRSNLKKVEAAALSAAKKIQDSVPGAVKDYVPAFGYTAFGEAGIKFTLVLQAERFSDKFAITSELIKALKESFDKEKIEISVPVRKIVK